MYVWKIKKTMEISASHLLKLPYDSKCCFLHGHNWKIEVHMLSTALNQQGMIMDFGIIKGIVMQLDHIDLTNIFSPDNSTAENIAKWIACQITEALSPAMRQFAKVEKVVVIESEGNEVCYTP